MPVLRQLPRWAWIGGGVLAFIAGMVNAAGYMGFRHQSISNLTGSTTLLGIALGTFDGAEALHWTLSLAAFVVGAMLSGVIVQKSTLKLGRPYGFALLFESVLLFAAVPLLQREWSAGLWLASMACGLQNGMVSTYSGMVFRTTHVSGMFTDLGIYLGHRLRGLEVDSLRVRVCVLVIATFMLGGVAGAILFGRLREQSLLIPATLTGLCGVLYSLYRQRATSR
ncbi:YoaK family protein [Frateuria hangzhouensis]|uniref:YoaK family protein n=1 Tax=Frateuria hangzhouensis TaxID=2995589 RepID=UPI002260CDAE|nr:YoaK family protein [Frateuria sp. STR12]MCX7514945.1 YoaK family protein [Frateuria sp. STR12]